MRGWSDLAERVGGTTRTSEKTTLLAAYLARLSVDELRPAATFLTGRPFPESDQRAVGLGWATVAAAVSQMSGAPSRRSARHTTARPIWVPPSEISSPCARSSPTRRTP